MKLRLEDTPTLRIALPLALALVTAFVLWTLSVPFFKLSTVLAGFVLGLLLPRRLTLIFVGFWIGLASAWFVMPQVETNSAPVQFALTLFSTALTSLKVLAAAFIGRVFHELGMLVRARPIRREECLRLLASYDRPVLAYLIAMGLWLSSMLYVVSTRPELTNASTPYMLGVYLALPSAIVGVFWRRVSTIAVGLNGAFWFPAALFVLKGQLLTGVFGAIAVGFTIYRLMARKQSEYVAQS